MSFPFYLLSVCSVLNQAPFTRAFSYPPLLPARGKGDLHRTRSWKISASAESISVRKTAEKDREPRASMSSRSFRKADNRGKSSESHTTNQNAQAKHLLSGRERHFHSQARTPISRDSGTTSKCESSSELRSAHKHAPLLSTGTTAPRVSLGGSWGNPKKAEGKTSGLSQPPRAKWKKLW